MAKEGGALARLPVKEGGNPTAEHATMGAGVYQNPNVPDGPSVEIRNVWAYNLEEEIAKMCEVVEDYPYVAMDTEFPGVVARPICPPNSPDYAYQSLRCNCDLLRIIQLGLCFADENGNFPPGCQCWQFNFKFSLSEDMYAQDSIDLLQSSGINFDLLEADGIDVQDFAELLMSSGLVLVPDVKWVTFHSGYDFGYLLKLLTDVALPQDESRFFELLLLYFPSLYDIKYMMNDVNMHGGLSKLADDLGCDRIGPMHQAGSDALLTLLSFNQLVEVAFSGVAEERFKGELFGYGTNHTAGYRPQLAVTFSKPTPPMHGASGGHPSGSASSRGMSAHSPTYNPGQELTSLLTGGGAAADDGGADSPAKDGDAYDPDALQGDPLTLGASMGDVAGLDSEGGSSSSSSSSGSMGLHGVNGGNPNGGSLLGGLGSMSLGPSASVNNTTGSMSLSGTSSAYNPAPNHGGGMHGGYGGNGLNAGLGLGSGFGGHASPPPPPPGNGAAAPMGMNTQGYPPRNPGMNQGMGPGPMGPGGPGPDMYGRRNPQNPGSGPGRGYGVGVNVS
mmetsp:Transcript_22786/g.70590  ORF Transcript_22786/g.70590 Transcript_22786/m.70590 type:complete len:559 (-) Transcript_22786:1972-3648(-)|eukprot:CAMPEP_0118886040 /NCGR_PEP_ID=MMETSP1163-20130328/24276_1 /TAXON_ID=124430 /ORGANISM="Phaeomonas parva, Strain CCMP2877" /LENGTH=558 /DNA_ID=CAMNT_0006824169 /DNA_START=260 /DNA_END=1936 /DNA_ORIENTATION=+